jgi:hypothetical protein
MVEILQAVQVDYKQKSWDGSSWTEVNDLATARYNHGGSGASNISFSFWWFKCFRYCKATEEWSFTGLDPSTTPAADYADAITGDFYYNSTTGQFKTVNTMAERLLEHGHQVVV